MTFSCQTRLPLWYFLVLSSLVLQILVGQAAALLVVFVLVYVYLRFSSDGGALRLFFHMRVYFYLAARL